mmetsp:Transcript_39198/g.85464  ORF Transcript_39198/g.85464 Transcript_39198/m.85464 type:complete len:207 (+) Transcript_39198:119-739(+)|eukprot:CAMPEP_0204275316 /NCGR_PEP_ID=MMETSP0468-20130131/25748_1 /ASSEMBLY_ACC=CAM_ASM_000383 /TAXON_ID=2969 /ORGANISM="Oxyrrhis marina" /LENGTH=206 /DNA_ID=CAMNT_0051251639 /DNA_START=117 /DNA_END=737 /DNA_ORIENTATION=-
MVWTHFLWVVTVIVVAASGGSVVMQVDARAHVSAVGEVSADLLEVTSETPTRAATDNRFPSSDAAELTWSVEPPKRKVQVDAGTVVEAVVQTTQHKETSARRPWVHEVMPLLLEKLSAARQMSPAKIATSAVGVAMLLALVFAAGFGLYRWNLAKQREEMMDQNEQLIAKLTRGKHKWSREAFGRIPREPLIGGVVHGDCGPRWQN